MRNQYRELIKLYTDREYTGKNIVLDNVSHSKIRSLEILGETAEIGEGEKSPDNPFVLVGAISPTVTVNGQMCFTNLELNSASSVADIYNPLTGEYVQRVGKLVLNGTEEWTENNKYEGTNISIRFVSAIIQNLVKPAAGNDIVANIKCSHYVEKTTQFLGSNYLEGVAVSSSGGLSIRDFFEDAAGFKSFLAAQYEAGTPVTVLYELAEPVTTTINQTDLKANIPDTTISLTEANNLGNVRAVLQTKGE